MGFRSNFMLSGVCALIFYHGNAILRLFVNKIAEKRRYWEFFVLS